VEVRRLEDVVGKGRFETLAEAAGMTRSEFADYLTKQILEKLDALDAGTDSPSEKAAAAATSPKPD
jgi:uncharacterized protein YidB (DUF937 family)